MTVSKEFLKIPPLGGRGGLGASLENPLFFVCMLTFKIEALGNRIKLSLNNTKWTRLWARTYNSNVYVQLRKIPFGHVKAPGTFQRRSHFKGYKTRYPYQKWRMGIKTWRWIFEFMFLTKSLYVPHKYFPLFSENPYIPRFTQSKR